MRGLVAVLALAVVLAACRQDMHDQPRYTALQGSSFFEDGRASRAPVEGTVARGLLEEDAHLHDGRVNDALAETFPFPVTREVLERGRERYDIYCSPCHDRLGSGLGVIVQRGFRHPPSLHIERLREAAPGHFFDVITNGFGVMQDYAVQVEPRDRWAIIGYIRALQLSQHARLADVSAADRERLEEERAR